MEPSESVFLSVNTFFASLNEVIGSIFFLDLLFFTDAGELPLLVAWLVAGAVFFTLRLRFINIRAFLHGIKVVSGHYDDPDDEGEVSHFQALSAALSATVGLGNIAGVAIAVSVGGPGATLWMVVAGFLGMSTKFVECTLGQMYREVREDGHVMGGAMEYLSRGFAEFGRPQTGRILAALFCVLCIGASFGGGNAFQSNQSFAAVRESFPMLEGHGWIYGIVMAVAVATVIIGGIERIAQTAGAIVPLMCGLYVAACLFIIISNFSEVPAAVATIIAGAFTPEAGYGGVLGVLVMGFRRAAFSNEAGIGSAAIAHSAARTQHPVREGVVALLEPFIDTILVCSMTALVIVMTGAYDQTNPAYVELIVRQQGAALTAAAFSSEISWFPVLLSIAVVLFAYSTMISWSYYGERCWTYLFGERFSLLYRLIFIVFTFLGAITSSTSVLEFSDLMILGMAFPNIIGLYFLTSKVSSALDSYMARLRAGEFS